MSRGDRRILLSAAGCALMLTALAAALIPGADTSDVPTTYSSGSGGTKALYLTLLAAHYPVSRWEQSPRDLPADANATLILADPSGVPTLDERSAVQRFLEQGGRVIATGPSGALFLPNARATADPIAGLTWVRMESRSPSFITRAARAITLAPAASWRQDAAALPLYGDASGDGASVVKADVAKGEMLWWASATPLTNAGVTAPDNLAFVLASLGDPHRPILWDEYFHGHRSRTPASALASPFAWAILPLAIGVLAVLLTYSRRSGPIVVPAAESRLSPLEFVRTLGSLYESAGAASLAVDIAYQRFHYGLRRRFLTTGAESADDLARIVTFSGNVGGDGLTDVLRRCESARDNSRLTAATALALTQSLNDCAAQLNLFRTMTKEHA